MFSTYTDASFTLAKIRRKGYNPHQSSTWTTSIRACSAMTSGVNELTASIHATRKLAGPCFGELAAANSPAIDVARTPATEATKRSRWLNSVAPAGVMAPANAAIAEPVLHPVPVMDVKRTCPFESCNENVRRQISEPEERWTLMTVSPSLSQSIAPCMATVQSVMYAASTSWMCQKERSRQTDTHVRGAQDLAQDEQGLEDLHDHYCRLLDQDQPAHRNISAVYDHGMREIWYHAIYVRNLRCVARDYRWSPRL